MTIVDSINAVHTRLVRNKRIRLALISALVVSYIAFIVTILSVIARPLGWLVGAALLGIAGYRGYRKKIFTAPTIEDASALIDQRFDTKDRALTLAATWDDAGDAEKELLTQQLQELVPEFDVDAAFPLTLETGLKRALATLPVVWGLLWYLGGNSGNATAERQAAIVSELLEQRADIPLPVRESLMELKNTLETKPLTDQAVLEALQAAQAEIDQANESLDSGADDSTGETVDESESADGDSGGEIAEESPKDVAAVGSKPTPTPEPTPTAPPGATEPPPNQSKNEEQQQQEEKKDSAEQKQKEEQDSGSSNDTDVQNSKSSDQQSGSENQPSQSKNDGGEGGSKSEQQQSGSQKGESQGEQGQEGSEEGQEGDGDGNSSSKQGQKPGKSGGQSGSQGQGNQQGEQQGSGEGKSEQGGQKKSGGKGDRAGDKTSAGQDTGLEQAQDALNKIEQELKAQQQGEEKGDQEGEKEGGEKGDKGESDSGKPSGAGGKKQGQSEKKQGAGQGQQGDKDQGKEQGESKQDKKESGGKSGGKDGQGGKPSDTRPESGSEGDNEPKEEFGEAPKLPVGSSLPKESDAAMGPGDENGGLGQGLGDRKGFKDTEIKTGDEKYDTRFTGKDGKVGLNKGPARSRTNLEDVKLAKPDPVKDPTEQPIPLEYRDILE